MTAMPRPLIIKIDANQRRRRDRLTNFLGEAGFQVINATSIGDGIKLGQGASPHLIIAVDSPRRGLDAERWLRQQHNNPNGDLAMTPLLILADNGRIAALRIHELPDRVKVISSRIEPEVLVEEIRTILSIWHF